MNANTNVPTPNVYFATLYSVETGKMHHAYIAGQYIGQAVAKVRAYCEQELHFSPKRTTSEINMRRFLLGDYVDNPTGLQEAIENEDDAHIRSRLESRQAALLELAGASWDEVGAALGVKE